ncbi:MAG: SigE family RNA polymerase sigma factor [Actinomycetota bacterium]|nr:SigE family RNA polymerase sigma factor [Actinomycetota bacterium]
MTTERVLEKPGIGELYLQHADTATRLAYLLTGDQALAEDLMQDAFVKVAGRLAHVRDPQAFEPYLRKTIVNLSRSHFRRRQVERKYLERMRASNATAVTHLERPVEERDELWSRLMTLSPRQRAALVLRFYEDLSEAEVAHVLKCAPGTVKSLVSRGLEKLRVEIRGEQ